MTSDWRTVALGDVVECFFNGGTPSTKNAAFWRGSIPWITGADIVDQKVTQPRRNVTLDGIRNSATQVVPKGGVLIVTRTGVGKVALAPSDVAISQDITGLIPRSDVLLGSYLYWWLATNSEQLQRQRQGTSINGILREDLVALRLPVPPLHQQHRIVGVISAIQDVIDKTEQVISHTEQFRQTLLHELLTHGIPGWHNEWMQVPGIGTIPACWKVVRLEEAAQVQTGRAVGKASTNGRVSSLPYLSVANVKDGYLDLTTVKSMAVTDEEAARFSLRRGDVLFTEGGDADKLGRGCVWNAEIEPCLHQNHVFAVRPAPAVLRPAFLATYARTRPGKAYFLLCAKQTTNLASINSTQLRQFPIPLPPLSEQDAILAAVDSIPSSVETANALRVLKTTMANALLSGRIRVPSSERLPGVLSRV